MDYLAYFLGVLGAGSMISLSADYLIDSSLGQAVAMLAGY